MSRPAKTHYAFHMTVSGSGNFPVDMLRYDKAVPLRQEDVAAIEGRAGRGERDVRLLRFGLGADSRPTEERWVSFGWRVVAHGRWS